jgi:hypothetical protein
VVRNDTNRRGTSAHLAVAQRLVQLGYEVLQPFDQSLSYDLAAIMWTSNGWFRSAKPIVYRIQCKAAHLAREDGVVVFNGYIRGNGRRHGYWGEAEWFGVYCEAFGRVFLVPVQAFPDGAEIRLRVKKTKNNQEEGIHWAKDYEI